MHLQGSRKTSLLFMNGKRKSRKYSLENYDWWWFKFLFTPYLRYIFQHFVVMLCPNCDLAVVPYLLTWVLIISCQEKPSNSAAAFLLTACLTQDRAAAKIMVDLGASFIFK